MCVPVISQCLINTVLWCEPTPADKLLSSGTVSYCYYIAVLLLIITVLWCCCIILLLLYGIPVGGVSVYGHLLGGADTLWAHFLWRRSHVVTSLPTESLIKLPVRASANQWWLELGWNENNCWGLLTCMNGREWWWVNLFSLNMDYFIKTDSA